MRKSRGKKWKKKKQEREKAESFSAMTDTFFLAVQTDAEADGGELTEDGRRRNEKA